MQVLLFLWFNGKEMWTEICMHKNVCLDIWIAHHEALNKDKKEDFFLKTFIVS